MLSQIDCHLWVETETLLAILAKILTLAIILVVIQQLAVLTRWKSKDELLSTTANANKNLTDALTNKAND